MTRQKMPSSSQSKTETLAADGDPMRTRRPGALLMVTIQSRRVWEKLNRVMMIFDLSEYDLMIFT